MTDNGGLKVTFNIEARTVSSTQREAGKRLFARLIARAQASGDAGQGGLPPAQPQLRRPTPAADAKRTAERPPHLLTGGRLRTGKGGKP